MVHLETSTDGEITFLGQPLAANGCRVPLLVGYMPQSGAAVNQLTVGEALYFTAHLRGMSRAQARSERDALLELWQIQGLRDKPGSRLSGGEKRLLQLAIAMAGAPPILILDEPTNELSPQRRKQVWDVLRSRNQAQRVTIIFITHDAIEAEKIIQRVGILRQGELVALGRPGELKRQVDRKLRLELFFNPERPPDLPSDLSPHVMDAGRWLVYIERDQVDSVFHSLDFAPIDDFRLYSATLEDLYLHYAGATHTSASLHSVL
jgi:ABC-type multidrug transport system ATPase subunit